MYACVWAQRLLPTQEPARRIGLESDTNGLSSTQQVAKWTVGKMGRDRNPQLTGSIVLAGPRPEESPPLQVDWKVHSYLVLNDTRVLS